VQRQSSPPSSWPISPHLNYSPPQDNLVTYWGQNSEGATNNNKAVWQQPLSFYCNDDTVDTFPIAFVDQFQGAGGLPVMDLANICNNE
jgi:chitinase